MAKKYTKYDILYRLNKARCCFAEKTAALVKKQRYGKPCDDEACNVKLLGAYIEMIECMVADSCDCSQEWVTGGSLVWDYTQDYDYGQIVKVFPREDAIDTQEFLYFKWKNTFPTMSLFGYDEFYNEINAAYCFEEPSPGGSWIGQGHSTPCFSAIGFDKWSVCGNIKQAWEIRGGLIWSPLLLYQYGDIVKFMGGGTGADQGFVEAFYISKTNNNQTSEFHESDQWARLDCFELIN
tara:strand:- start:37838 stop:38548 length:711 start_codon:yes stop_codon:yes gene_type:complete